MNLRYPMRATLAGESVCVFDCGTGWITVNRHWFRYDCSIQNVIKLIPDIAEVFIEAYTADARPDKRFIEEVAWVTNFLK